MNPINKFSKQKEEEILKLYSEGKNQKEIGKIFNTWNTSIRRVLLRNGVKPRGNAEIQSFMEHNPFIEDKYKDYFIGLLVTDGCISKGSLTLSLKEEDKYMLENFARFLGNKVKVNKYFHKAHNHYEYYVKVKYRPVTDYLPKVAKFENKSKELELYIPISWEILRGIFDGDGGVTVMGKTKKQLRWFVCGASKIFIYQIYDFLREEGYNPTITSNGGMFYVNLYRKKELCSLFEDLYKNADMFLVRKYVKMATFVEKSME